MAEKTEEGKAPSSSENLTCPLCLDIFDEATILTSCGHTFCRKCLKNYDLSHQDLDHMICPLCRNITKLSANRVDDFPTNVTVNGLVDEYHTKCGGMNAVLEMRPKCTACKFHEDAVSFCKTCNFYMCTNCDYSHNQLTSVFEGHDIVSIEDIINGKVSVGHLSEKCCIHKQENKDMFCDDCKVHVCFKCVIVGHHNHKIKNQADFEQELRLKVKILYVRNLMLHTTEETIAKEFNAFKEGSVERVKKLRDFAFIHFFTREDALNAMNAMDDALLDGAKIEVVLAKPVDKGNYVRYTRGAGRGYVQQGLYGYEQQQQQQSSPSYYPGYSNPTGMPPMMGMGGGRGGGMMQRSPIRGGTRGRGGGGGMRGAGGTRSYGMGRGYNRYDRKPQEPRLFDLLSGMELTPTNPVTIKPEKNNIQVLEELCNKNQWGPPSFTPLSHRTNSEVQLFIYKVTVPGLSANYPDGLTPQKLCQTPDQSKNLAAECLLASLGVPVDGEL